MILIANQNGFLPGYERFYYQNAGKKFPVSWAADIPHVLIQKTLAGFDVFSKVALDDPLWSGVVRDFNANMIETSYQELGTKYPVTFLIDMHNGDLQPFSGPVTLLKPSIFSPIVHRFLIQYGYLGTSFVEGQEVGYSVVQGLTMRSKFATSIAYLNRVDQALPGIGNLKFFAFPYLPENGLKTPQTPFSVEGLGVRNDYGIFKSISEVTKTLADNGIEDKTLSDLLPEQLEGFDQGLAPIQAPETPPTSGTTGDLPEADPDPTIEPPPPAPEIPPPAEPPPAEPESSPPGPLTDSGVIDLPIADDQAETPIDFPEGQPGDLPNTTDDAATNDGQGETLIAPGQELPTTTTDEITDPPLYPQATGGAIPISDLNTWTDSRLPDDTAQLPITAIDDGPRVASDSRIEGELPVQALQPLPLPEGYKVDDQGRLTKITPTGGQSQQSLLYPIGNQNWGRHFDAPARDAKIDPSKYCGIGLPCYGSHFEVLPELWWFQIHGGSTR